MPIWSIEIGEDEKDAGLRVRRRPCANSKCGRGQSFGSSCSLRPRLRHRLRPPRGGGVRTAAWRTGTRWQRAGEMEGEGWDWDMPEGAAVERAEERA